MGETDTQPNRQAHLIIKIENCLNLGLIKLFQFKR